MGLTHTALLLLGASWALAGVSPEAKRQTSSTTKYCPGNTSVCFSQFETPTSNIIYRIAIPDVSSAPFDVLLQIVAPVSTTGWAGVAWGGSMTKNPLTVGWASGSGAIVSSRWATGHSLPQPYTGATYTVLPTSTTNATHWQLDVLCTGCSQWSGTSLNPNGANTLAWAKGSKAVTTPGSNTSTFAYHDDKGEFSHDLSLGKIPKGVFDALAYAVGSSSSSSSSSTSAAASASTPAASLPPTSSSVPVVLTSVTVLPPRPSTTRTSLSATGGLSTTGKATSSAVPTTIITRPTTSLTWTPDQPRPTGASTVVVAPPPKPTRATTVVGPPWGSGGGSPVGHRPPWRGPPWRRPPGAGEEGVE